MKRKKPTLVVSVIMLIFLLGSTVGVLGFATKGFKQKPSLDNIKNIGNKDNKKNKPEDKNKIEYDKELDRQKELAKVKSQAAMNGVFLGSSGGRIRVNKELIRQMKEYGEKEPEYKNTEEYKAMYKLTSGYKEERIQEIQIGEGKIVLGILLTKDRYTTQSYINLINLLESGDKRRFLRNMKIQGVATEEQNKILALIEYREEECENVTNHFTQEIENLLIEMTEQYCSKQVQDFDVKNWFESKFSKRGQLFRKTEEGFSLVNEDIEQKQQDEIIDIELMFIRADLVCESERVNAVDMFISVIGAKEE